MATLMVHKPQTLEAALAALGAREPGAVLQDVDREFEEAAQAAPWAAPALLGV